MKQSRVYRDEVLEPAFENFSELFGDHSLSVNKAHLVMLKRTGILTAETASKIKKGIGHLEKNLSLPSSLPEDVEDYFFFFERTLGNSIGPEIAGALHTARSRNDMDATIFRMFVRGDLLELLRRSLSFSQKIFERAMDGLKTPIVLYTHGQPAQPSTLGHYLTSFLIEILESLECLANAMLTVNESPMGACAITTTGFGIDRELVSSLLGFEAPVTNSHQAIATSHWLTFPAMWMISYMNDITRFVADLSHKSSCDVGIFSYPDDLVQTSSIMPQKRNPVILEHVRIHAGLALGRFETVERLFSNLPYQDVNELSYTPVKFFHGGVIQAMKAVALLEETVRKIEVDEKRVEEVSAKAGATSTELADELVRREGLDFRSAHTIVAKFAESRFDHFALLKAFRETTGKTLDLSSEEIDDIMSVKNFIEVRRVSGGPSEEGMRSVVGVVELKLNNLEDFAVRFSEKLKKSSEELDREFEGL